jgi:hypothetical protein
MKNRTCEANLLRGELRLPAGALGTSGGAAGARVGRVGFERLGRCGSAFPNSSGHEVLKPAFDLSDIVRHRVR